MEEEEELEEELGDETMDSSYCPSITSSSECGGEREHSHTCTDGSSGAEYSLNHSRRGGRHSSSSVGVIVRVIRFVCVCVCVFFFKFIY